MNDPVASRYGHLYERKCIEEWVRRKGNCPFTGKRLEREEVYPVYALKMDISEFKRRRAIWQQTTDKATEDTTRQ